jgi:hypothetical protein
MDFGKLKMTVGLGSGFLLLLVLIDLAVDSHFVHHTLTTQQMRAVTQTAGHGKVTFVQAKTIHGISVALVRYPDHTLHTVFFLAHGDTIHGIVVGGKVYTAQGKNWRVRWTSLPAPDTHQPEAPPAAPVPASESNNPIVQAQKLDKKVGTGPITPQSVLRYAAYAHGFVWGKEPQSPIDALVDPNCIFCHRWFESEKAAVDAGKISFRIIPVAALKPSSIPRAIEILSAKEPLQLWLRDEQDFDTRTESGGIPVNLLKNPNASKSVAVNTAILFAVDNHHPYTPTFIDTRTGQVWMGVNHDKELQHAFVQP